MAFVGSARILLRRGLQALYRLLKTFRLEAHEVIQKKKKKKAPVHVLPQLVQETGIGRFARISWLRLAFCGNHCRQPCAVQRGRVMSRRTKHTVPLRDVVVKVGLNSICLVIIAAKPNRFRRLSMNLEHLLCKVTPLCLSSRYGSGAFHSPALHLRCAGAKLDLYDRLCQLRTPRHLTRYGPLLLSFSPWRLIPSPRCWPGCARPSSQHPIHPATGRRESRTSPRRAPQLPT